ncbi:MAG: sigma-54-dependent Fis family transcriptional regulator [Deltaproteobacteria bacterium]|nr:sigma-54-dependent Fis family transcriptional regulator [Deltaproteobacteria bacterium]
MSAESYSGTILVVDDDPDIREVLSDRLQSLGYRVLLASNGRASLELLERQNPHMILLDIEMPDMSGLEVLREIRRRGADVTVVMITAHGTIERAVQAMKEGAYDFIRKPFEPEHIALTVQKALEREGLKRGVEVLSEEVCERHRLVVGRSAQMSLAVELARKAAASKATVLLLGESGTGKEIFARAIHRWSDRKDKPFIAINCVGLSRELLESELFGHEKGAFTGAHQLKRGKMELAHGGTVFLDEIGDISLELQTKLLRFLQEREFERVGGTKSIHVDVRIIGATNRDLDQAVKDGRFREDLYYRLNVVPIALPPLRERKEDIAELATDFLKRFSAETKKRFVELAPETIEKLLSYDWPGNVRELANAIERAVVLGEGPTLTVQHLPPRISSRETVASAENFSYHNAVNAAKRELIRRALSQTQGNRAAAAKLLGLQRTYLSRLIKTLRIP